MVYRKPVETEAVSAEELGLGREVVSLTVDGTKHELDGGRAVIGRSKDCDIQLADPNVSRRHAEVRQEGAAYWVVDLGSTNGMEVNGRARSGRSCGRAIAITVGSTELVFRRETEGTSDRLRRGRGDAARPQVRVPRPPLPLHLADRQLGGA